MSRLRRWRARSISHQSQKRTYPKFYVRWKHLFQVKKTPSLQQHSLLFAEFCLYFFTCFCGEGGQGVQGHVGDFIFNARWTDFTKQHFVSGWNDHRGDKIQVHVPMLSQTEGIWTGVSYITPHITSRSLQTLRMGRKHPHTSPELWQHAFLQLKPLPRMK